MPPDGQGDCVSRIGLDDCGSDRGFLPIEILPVFQVGIERLPLLHESILDFLLAVPELSFRTPWHTPGSTPLPHGTAVCVTVGSEASWERDLNLGLSQAHLHVTRVTLGTSCSLSEPWVPDL